MDWTVREVCGCVVAVADAGERLAGVGLTRGERRECAALVDRARRGDYRAARLAAKRAVARLGGRGAGDAGALRRVSARRRAGAPPLVRARAPGGAWRALPGALSLAHEDGRGAAAAPPPGPPGGGGVAPARADDPAPQRDIAAPPERRRGPRDAAALWALKEAAWKALALGPACPLRAVALEFTAAGRVTAVRVRGRRVPARAALLRPWRGHVVAVLVAGAR